MHDKETERFMLKLEINEFINTANSFGVPLKENDNPNKSIISVLTEIMRRVMELESRHQCNTSS